MLIRLTLLLALASPTPELPAEAPPSLAEIADIIDLGKGDSVEPLLQELHAANPRDAEVMAQLARIEYLRAVSGRAQPRDGLLMQYDPVRLESAERWAKQAVEANPDHANAWIVYGQVLNTRTEPERSLTMLERAEALDPASVKLRLRKGETLRTLAAYRGDPSLLPSAIREFRRAIKGRVDNGNEVLAASEAAKIYATLGQPEQARDQLSQAIEASEGRQLALLLEQRARFNLEAGDVDAAVADSRAALQIMEFGVAKGTLADALLVKAGLAMRDIGVAPTIPHLNAFFETGRSPFQGVHLLAAKPSTFPAVYALLAPQFEAAGGAAEAARVVGESAGFITSDELRRLHGLGLSFDASDEVKGTLLHRAIAADRVDVVRTLLELGADASIPLPGGTTTLQAASTGSSEARQEIRRLLSADAGMAPGSEPSGVELPTPGRWYRAERTIGLADHANSKLFEEGMTLLAGNLCQTPDKPYVCFTFYTAPGEYYTTLLVPQSQIEDFKALREVEAPQ